MRSSTKRTARLIGSMKRRTPTSNIQSAFARKLRRDRQGVSNGQVEGSRPWTIDLLLGFFFRSSLDIECWLSGVESRTVNHLGQSAARFKQRVWLRDPLKPLALAAFLALAVALPCSGKENAIQCANLIYGGNHTSRCFSDEFLAAVQKQTAISTERHFKSVKLDSDELFNYPFVMMTGESNFHFTARERENIKKYLTSGGFLLASAGCSNKDWDRAFRREMKAIFPDNPLKKIEMNHPVFRTVNTIDKLKLHHAGEEPRLEGVEHNGKIVAIYSPHGLNDTTHTEGCCCCGGNEIENSIEVNMNILVYALLH